jgi:hypothetical protein
MLLMRDRRSVAAPAEAKPENTAVAAKAKEANNLVAKTEVVYEVPGDEKTMFRRVVDKINPFSSSASDKPAADKKDEKKEAVKPKSAVELLAKNKGQKTESKGFFASLWPFGGDSAKTAPDSEGGSNAVINRVDDSLKEKGIDPRTQTAALKTPAIDLPKVDDLEPKQGADSAKLLGQIDSALKKEGKATSEPKPPESAPVFKNPEMAQAAIAKAQPPAGGAQQNSVTTGLLGGIDEKLKGKGVEPGAFESAPTGKEADTKPAAPREINLEPKVAKEKGPLFLNPAEAPEIQQPASENVKSETAKEGAAKPEEPVPANITRALVRGPQQPAGAAPAAKPDEQKKPAAKQSEENKGAFEQLQQDLDSVGKLLNPFRW